jgi:hypothetical protein
MAGCVKLRFWRVREEREEREAYGFPHGRLGGRDPS